MKNLIIYQSIHHHNTEKIVKHLAANYPIDLLNISQATSDLVNKYDNIIFAGGVYFGKPHRLLYEILPSLRLKNKDIYLITTSGACSLPVVNDYHRNFKQLFSKFGLDIRSWFETRGFDSFPIFVKPFGGINKNHPDQKDLDNVSKWFDSLALNPIM